MAETPKSFFIMGYFMEWADDTCCRHRQAFEKWRSWGDACVSSRQPGTGAGQRVSEEGIRSDQCRSQALPRLPDTLLSATCVLWPLPRSAGSSTGNQLGTRSRCDPESACLYSTWDAVGIEGECAWLSLGVGCLMGDLYTLVRRYTWII